MASVTSLGIHWPCALQHLVAESILPHDPANDQYDWQTIDGSDDGENNSEELLTTKHCVVWSQGGIVRRVFRFEVENEGVVQAILTWFPTEDTRNKPDRSEEPNRQTAATANTSRRVSNDCGKAAGSSPSLESQSSRSPDTGDNLQQCQQKSLPSLKRRDRARALVVVLRTQAHIYFLSGTSHVLNLPFEVDSILPTPRGLLLQRKIPIQPAAPNSPVDQLVPPNSFVSPQTQPWTPQGLQFGLYCLGSGISSKPSTQATSVPAIVSGPYQADANANLPRLFSLTDTMSELGLVVEAPTAGSTLDSLSHAEDIIYVSKLDELYNESLSKSTPSLLFAVTSNEQTGMHTVWSLSYVEPQSVSARARMWTPTTSDTLSRRRSSHGLTGAGTGATTPMGRGPISTRESFGMRTRNHNVPGSSNVNMSITSTGEDINLDAGNELASQLDLEFENPGAPAKSSRRVRSLLARADLSTSHDKLAFSDLVTGHPSTASGYAAGNRRGESFGGYSSRGSFGYSVGPSRRGSVPANSFNLSVSNFHNTPADDLVEDVNDDHHLGDFEGSGHHVAVRGLRKEVVLTRIGSFPIQRSEVERLTRKDNMPSKIKVFTMLPPPSPVVDEHEGAIIYICIVNRTDRKLLVLKVEIKQRAGPRSSQNTHFDLTTDFSAVSRATKAKVTEMRRAQGIIDVCRLTHGDIHRMLVLSETDDGHGEITLQAPWSTLVRLELPSMLAIYHPFHIGRAVSPSRRREGGLKRVLSEGPRELIGLQHEAHGGEVDLVDAEGTRHRVKVQLIPHDSQVVKVLRVCQFVLPGSDYGGDGILVGWWEVNRWFQSMGEAVVDHEWAALVVVLFAMAVNFISDKQSHGAAKQRKRKTGLLRSSSGAKVDLENWDSMLDEEGSSHGALPRWSKGAGWEWIMDQEDQLMVSDQKAGGSTRSTRSSSTATTSITTITRHNGFLVRCASLAREFLKSPAGRAASGEQGYLPTAASKDPEIQRTALATVLIGLHLLEEDAKLDIATPDKSRHGFGRLTPILAQIGGWLGWENWSWKENAYYSVEDVEMNKWLFEDSVISSMLVPTEPFPPPSLLSFVAACLHQNQRPTFLSLLDIVRPALGSRMETRSVVASPGVLMMKELTPRTILISELFLGIFDRHKSMSRRVQDMIRCGTNALLLESLPEGLAAPLREAIIRCQGNPPITWDVQALELVGRDDLSMLLSTGTIRSESLKSLTIPSHDATRDVHNISISTLETDTIGAFDGSAEVDRQCITRLIFREDRRFMEAAKLVHPMKPAIARCVPEPDWSEADLLEAQKELVQTVAVRTLAVPSGRGLLYYSARVPLMTEKFPIHGFTLSCVMKPSNNTVTADRNAFTEEKVCWAFFHAGVSAGLSISRDAKGIDTSWIQFNKPAELNNRHAGFLLALGLNGHLKSIAKWVAFKYLTPKHTMTSIGLLLGLSASYLGTMDTLITRLLSVHVTRMLPPGAAELNLSPLTQTTGIMGIGLLYCGTQHRRMSEVMLSEIEHVDPEDPSTPLETLRDEGYRLAAGFALGYINLGKGKDLKGLHDMAIVERLLSLAVGTKKVNIVHILDKATAGATIAIALIFMKSHNEVLARKVDVPDTIHQFGYVRPDIFLLRTLSRHLIMWDDIQATSAWIKSSLPPIYRRRVNMTSIRILNSEDMPFYNIVAGICFSMGLRFAGSGSLEVRNLLGHYLDQYMRICKLPALNYDGKLTQTTVRNCQDLLALSAACVMAGSGDIHTFRRLRALHGRVNADTPYGSHLAAHIAIGVLFLGGGNFTFGTSNIAVASLVCAFYPLFPTSVLDNKSHLQAFRHFWVLATEARCLVARDVDTRRPVSIPVSVTLRDGSERVMTAPGLLPELRDITTVRTNSMAYWQIVLDFANNPSHLSAFKRNQTIYVRKRAAHDAHSSVFSATLQALNGAQSSHVSRQIFDWVFDLPVFAGFDKAEQALVVPPDAGSAFHSGTKGTMVDDRLVLERASLGTGNRDRLWNLKLLFDWAEGVRQQDGRLRWLGKEVVEGLRAAVWMASSNEA